MKIAKYPLSSLKWQISNFLMYNLFTQKPLDLPAKSDKSSVDDLNNYFTALYTEKSIRESNIFTDFLSINWDGSDISFLYDLSGFLDIWKTMSLSCCVDKLPKA